MLIKDYNEEWVDHFTKIRHVLSEALLNLPVSIEHVGSTSVPQLAAKPIIDIDIAFNKDTAFDDIKERLTQIGYYHNGNQGIPGREAFKRIKTTTPHKVLDALSHHLYICSAASEELRRHILFRNYLRANEEARLQYQQLKYQLAEEVNQDRKKYAQLKEEKATSFINGIIEKANKL